MAMSGIRAAAAIAACLFLFACSDAPLPSGIDQDDSPAFAQAGEETAFKNGPQWVVTFKAGAGDPDQVAASLASGVGANVLHVPA